MLKRRFASKLPNGLPEGYKIRCYLNTLDFQRRKRLACLGDSIQLSEYTVVKKVRPGRNDGLANEQSIFDILERYPPSPYSIRSFYRIEGAIFPEYAAYGDPASLLRD